MLLSVCMMQTDKSIFLFMDYFVDFYKEYAKIRRKMNYHKNCIDENVYLLQTNTSGFQNYIKRYFLW